MAPINLLMPFIGLVLHLLDYCLFPWLHLKFENSWSLSCPVAFSSFYPLLLSCSPTIAWPIRKMAAGLPLALHWASLPSFWVISGFPVSMFQSEGRIRLFWFQHFFLADFGWGILALEGDFLGEFWLIQKLGKCWRAPKGRKNSIGTRDSSSQSIVKNNDFL